jgi:hypothetical protein
LPETATDAFPDVLAPRIQPARDEFETFRISNMKERDETTKEEMEAKKEAAESWRRSKIWHRRRNSLFNRWEMISSRPKLKSDLAILPVAHDNEARNPSVPSRLELEGMEIFSPAANACEGVYVPWLDAVLTRGGVDALFAIRLLTVSEKKICAL